MEVIEHPFKRILREKKEVKKYLRGEIKLEELDKQGIKLVMPLTMEKRILIMHHGIDLDGWASGAIIIKKLDETAGGLKELGRFGASFNDGTEVDFLPWVYGDSIPDVENYDTVFVCDLGLKPEQLLAMNNDSEVIWIDHHKSAIEEWRLYCTRFGFIEIPGLRSSKRAACELTWEYLYDQVGDIMPREVNFLGLYDSFRHKGTEDEQMVMEYQFGARAVANDLWSTYELLFTGGRLRNRLEVIYSGKEILRYLSMEAISAVNNGFAYTVIDINGNHYKALVINKERFNPSNFKVDYHSSGYDVCISFHYVGHLDTYSFSVYNENGEVDCSLIAENYGGGGHKGAAGFMLDDLWFNM